MRSTNHLGRRSRKAIRSSIVQALETRTLFSNNLIPTALEVYEVELINRARANPTAEVQRLASDPRWAGTPDLNEGLPAGTITTDPKQPLAINTILTFTSRNHSQYELDNNVFSHNEGTLDPFQRMTNAGYPSNSFEGENIASAGTSTPLDSMALTIQEQDELFIDPNTADRGHRTNIESPNYNEVGAGIATGVQGGFNTLNLTQDFGGAGITSFLCGITYHDTSSNNFFEPGEEVGGVTITATRTSDNAVFTTTSWVSGGYSLALAPGTYSVVASGSTIGSPAAKMVTIGTSNVEADFLQAAGAAAPVTLTGLNEYLKLDGDGVTLDTFAGTTATGTPTKFLLSQVSTLTVAPTSAGTGVVTVDFSAGNPLPTSGLSVNGSQAGLNLSLVVTGTTGNDTLTVSHNTATLGTNVITYTALTGISFNGDGGTDVLNQTEQPGGTATLAFPGSTATSTLNISGGTYTFAASTGGFAVDRFASVSISTGARINLAGPTTSTNRTLLQTNALSSSGVLDLGGNDLDLVGGSLLTIDGLVTGGGITSTSVTGNTTHLTALGVIQNNQGGTALFGAGKPFDGITPAASDILVKYTYLGDANLDGKVDGSDYSRIDSSSLSEKTGPSATSWFNGDFNYDNIVNGSDYTLIDNAFNRQGTSLAAQVATAAHPNATAINFFQTITPVTITDSNESILKKHNLRVWEELSTAS